MYTKFLYYNESKLIRMEKQNPKQHNIYHISFDI